MLPFTVETQQSNGAVRVIVRGELDMETGPRADDALRRIEASGPATVVLDLRDVSFFDSTGLQLVLDADVRAREEGRHFLVALADDGEPRRVLLLAEVLNRLTLEA